MTRHSRSTRTFSSIFAAALLLSACASTPTAPDGAAEARARLNLLQANPELASRAPIEIRDADTAVTAAEHPERDMALSSHLVLLADQKIEIANAWAQSRLYEDQRVALAREAEQARLDSRTREANLARSDAERARSAADAARSETQAARSDANTARTAAQTARGQSAVALAEADIARTDADQARTQTDLARQDSAAARAETEELQRQINELNARTTDRGLVVTLGDVLFETGMAELRGGTANNLDKLVVFLNRYPDRTVLIEGHTDSVGSESSNLSLSQRRADSVQSYLSTNGVNAVRLSAAGKGEASPVADNESSTGRQQNRRVEVIISNTTI